MGLDGAGRELGLGPTVGAVDIGSNTIKLTVGRPGGVKPVELLRASETVRLGMGVAATGRLDADRVEHAVAVLTRFAGLATEAGATRMVGAATEATRVAENGPAFLARVRRETGIEIGAISGAEEANLVFRGLAATVDLGGRVVAADIGGGSTEVLVVRDGGLESARSLRLGSGTLSDRFGAADPPTGDVVAAYLTAADEALDGTVLPSGATTRLIVIGGTGRYVARLAPAGRELDPRAVDEVLCFLGRTPARRVARSLGITRARALVLPAGVAVVRALLARTGAARLEVAASTLRIGLLLAVFEAESAVTGRDAVEGADGGGFGARRGI